jgi:glycosyltransferase involved in cell wall biosynthesis
MYPTPDDPAYGAFVASQMRSVQDVGVDVQVEFIDGRRTSAQYVRSIWELRRLARSGRFDLLHAHYGLTGFLSIFQPLPFVVSFCGDDLLGTPNGRGSLTTKSRLVRRLSWIAARRADGIICKSAELQAALPRETDRTRAHVIANGVDTHRFAPGDRARARAALGLSATEPLVLFPHTPTERRKRADLARLAVEHLRSTGIPARLWIVQKVPHQHMPLHYQAADCLLLTSDWEGSPNAVKEALCCDLPVVSVDAGDAGRWVRAVPGCVLVEREPTAISAGLARVLSGPGHIDGAGVRRELSLGAVATRLLAVYADVRRRTMRGSLVSSL